jgi:beta-hydroxylase
MAVKRPSYRVMHNEVRPPELAGPTLRKRARRIVVRAGKYLFRHLNNFLARQSLVGDTAILDNRHFPFLATLERDWRDIRDELKTVLEHRAALPSFHELSPDQWRISRGDNWKTFVFRAFGESSARNCARCPRTAALLQAVPGLQSAWFSILAPGYHIPAHWGITKGLLRVHLGLIVPRERERCRMSVGDELVVWEEGRCVTFDDTHLHEVHNDTDQERVVLLLDFDRPMKLPGRLAHRAMLRALKLSPYYKDARHNALAWEDRFEKSLASIEKALN